MPFLRAYGDDASTDESREQRRRRRRIRILKNYNIRFFGRSHLDEDHVLIDLFFISHSKPFNKKKCKREEYKKCLLKV